MIDISLLRNLIPLNALLPTDRQELARTGRVAEYRKGQTLFDRGEPVKHAVYLVEGEIELIEQQGVEILRAEDPRCLHPLSPGRKRAATAIALKPSRAVLLDANRLDVLLTWSQAGDMQVNEVGSGDDWMSLVLQSPAFERIPPAHIAQLLASLETVRVAALKPIIREGDPGDYYYVLSAGTALVMRETEGKRRGLARLKPGDGFGEEALVSGAPRNASVVAETDCELQRLSQEDFLRLLQEPLLQTIDLDDLPEDAHFIDVRLPEEFRAGHLPEALNLPLHGLRRECEVLQPEILYAVYCDTGRRSAAACFLLSQRGFRVIHIDGGVGREHLWFRS